MPSSALWGSLALTHETLNLFSFIGAVLLIGLVTKNGILLVDFANRLRHSGLDEIQAVRESAIERFRPIIMTTCAMIAGMLPLALALDPGSQAERSLGTVVIGGLTSSLLLTPLLVPIVYLKFCAASARTGNPRPDPRGQKRFGFDQLSQDLREETPVDVAAGEHEANFLTPYDIRVRASQRQAEWRPRLRQLCACP